MRCDMERFGREGSGPKGSGSDGSVEVEGGNFSARSCRHGRGRRRGARAPAGEPGAGLAPPPGVTYDDFVRDLGSVGMLEFATDLGVVGPGGGLISPPGAPGQAAG